MQIVREVANEDEMRKRVKSDKWKEVRRQG